MLQCTLASLAGRRSQTARSHRSCHAKVGCEGQRLAAQRAYLAPRVGGSPAPTLMGIGGLAQQLAHSRQLCIMHAHYKELVLRGALGIYPRHHLSSNTQQSKLFSAWPCWPR
jgi:hypothetical protein